MKVITTRYTGSGYVATDGDGNTARMSVDHGLSSEERHAAVARELCRRKKWVISEKTPLQGGHLLKDGKTVAMVWVWAEPTLQLRTP